MMQQAGPETIHSLSLSFIPSLFSSCSLPSPSHCLSVSVCLSRLCFLCVPLYAYLSVCFFVRFFVSLSIFICFSFLPAFLSLRFPPSFLSHHSRISTLPLLSSIPSSTPSTLTSVSPPSFLPSIVVLFHPLSLPLISPILPTTEREVLNQYSV